MAVKYILPVAAIFDDSKPPMFVASPAFINQTPFIKQMTIIKREYRL
jgi:hypothetical protein